MGRKRGPWTIEEILRKAKPRPSGCLEWMGSKNPRGYGKVVIGDRIVQVTRLMMGLVTGKPVPKGKVVMHICDNPPCVNPDHLRIDTQKENMRDSVSKGRNARGEGKVNSKLTEEDVRIIRRRIDDGVETHASIAMDYGIAKNSVATISSRATWGWLDEAMDLNAFLGRAA